MTIDDEPRDIALAYVGTPYPDARLTIEHATSSYGQPVLVIGGDAYGPADHLPNGMTARDWVRLAHHRRVEREFREGPEVLPQPWGATSFWRPDTHTGGR